MATTLYLSTRLIAAARAALRASFDNDAAAEGLACLHDAKPGFLANLIREDHPDRCRAQKIVAEALTDFADDPRGCMRCGRDLAMPCRMSSDHVVVECNSCHQLHEFYYSRYGLECRRM